MTRQSKGPFVEEGVELWRCAAGELVPKDMMWFPPSRHGRPYAYCRTHDVEVQARNRLRIPAQERTYTQGWIAQRPSIIKPPKPEAEMKIGYLDIETNGISKQDYSEIISWVIKTKNSDEMVSSIITEQDVLNDNDINDPMIRKVNRILCELSQALKQYDKIVTWFGAGFDIKALRTRFALLDIPFPSPWELIHEDLYFTAKYKYRITSNRLGYIAESFGCPIKKTQVSPKAWNLAIRGHHAACGYVLEHNKIDTLLLEWMDEVFKGQRRPKKAGL